MITVTVCVGSSCHIKGAREMIVGFNEFLTLEGLEDKVELKGSFCMERCGEGINWKINDQVVSSASAEEGVEMLRQQIPELLRQERLEEPGTRST
jgi:NADH:ubiquinone oxidoreductase subunit E